MQKYSYSLSYTEIEEIVNDSRSFIVLIEIHDCCNVM